MMNNDKQVQEIAQVPIIQRFLKNHALPLSFVEENIIEFLTWKEDLEKCRNCRGIAFCRQSFSGKVYQLDFDESGYLEERYVPCLYEQEKERLFVHRKQYLYSKMTMDDYLIDIQKLTDHPTVGSKEEYLEALRQVALSQQNEKGVYLYGQAGVGKSYMMKALCNYYAKQGNTVSFVNMSVWIQEIKESFGDDDYRQKILRKIRKSDIVVFDDIGSESMTAWSLNEILFPIIDRRMEQRKKTYFTSNYSMDELEQRQASIPNEGRVAANRIMERIRTLAVPVLLQGSSLR